MCDYKQAVAPILSQIRETWCSGASAVSMMPSATYAAMNLGSQATNKVVNLGEKYKVKPKTNPEVTEAARICMEIGESQPPHIFEIFSPYSCY